MAQSTPHDPGESEEASLDKQYWDWVEQVTWRDLGGFSEDPGHGPMPCGECGQCTDCLANIHQR